MATHSSKKRKLLGAPAPIDTGAPVFARLPADEHWVENVKLVKDSRHSEIPGVDFKRRVQSEGEAALKCRSKTNPCSKRQCYNDFVLDPSREGAPDLRARTLLDAESLAQLKDRRF